VEVVLSQQKVRLLRLKAQRLLPESASGLSSAIQAVQAVFALQAQELAAAYLSLRVRSNGLTAGELVQAHLVEHKLAWIWGLRGTLHLLSAQDARWLVPLLSPGLIASGKRRLRQLGWDEDRLSSGLQLLHNSLQQKGELTRLEITSLLQIHQLPYEGQAPFHLMVRAGLEGLLCLGQNHKGQSTYASFEAWLGPGQPLPRLEALHRLAQRFLQAYAPAAPEDLAYWSGLTLSEARQAWQLLSGKIFPVDAGGRTGWMLDSQKSWLDEPLEDRYVSTPSLRLLPRFDIYWLGYAQRDFSVDIENARQLHPGGGLLQSAILLNGKAAGLWKTRRRQDLIEIHIEPFKNLPAALYPALETEVQDIGRFLKKTAVLAV
jgi:hypothetical protein